MLKVHRIILDYTNTLNQCDVLCNMEYVVCDIDICCQIQQGSKKAKYSSSWDCARQLYRQGGITNVYRGTMATLLRGMVAKGCGSYDIITCHHIDVPASGVYFMTYEWLLSSLTPEGKS